MNGYSPSSVRGYVSNNSDHRMLVSGDSLRGEYVLLVEAEMSRH